MELRVDTRPFIENGCKWVETKKEGIEPCCITVPAHFECPQFQGFNCASIEKVPDYYGGLRPAVGMVECVFEGPWNAPTNDGIRYVGAGWLPLYEKFIVYTGRDFRLINNRVELWEYFSPIESKEEALSFAAALTGSYPIYEINVPTDYIKEEVDLEPTSVESVPEGFKVRLFKYQLGGCGPHYYVAIDYLVNRSGNLSELKRTNVWRDPKEDNLCVD